MHISHENLLRVLEYSPSSGNFTWRYSRGTKLKGSTAGTVTPTGYITIMLNRKNYAAHRLAWFYVHKEWPEEDIDHVNRIGTDNRILNLRAATKSQNQYNTGLSKNNSSGYKGVYFNKRDGRYVAQIMIEGKRISLGTHLTAFDAHDAYQKASLTYHGEFSSEM